MKLRHVISISAGFAVIPLFFLITRFLDDGRPEPRAEGEFLKIAELQSNEEVVTSITFSHLGAWGREYRIRIEKARPHVTIFDTTPNWARTDGRTEPNVLFLRELSQLEVAGLDETIAYCREVREELSSGERRIHLQYFRDGQQIGEELYRGFSLTSDLAYFAREGRRGGPEHADDYAELARIYGLVRERVERMISFEMLEREEPNPPLKRQT